MDTQKISKAVIVIWIESNKVIPLKNSMVSLDNATLQIKLNSRVYEFNLKAVAKLLLEAVKVMG